MARAWLRRGIVEIGPEGGTGRRIEGLRTSFRISMSDQSTPNEGEITLYNPAPTTAALAQAEDATVRLYVGYESDVPRLIFAGDPIAYGVTNQRQGVDRILKIQAKDGGRAYATTYLDASWDGEMTASQFFAAAADALGQPLGTVDLGGSDPRLPSLSMTGPVRQQLDRVAALVGAQWCSRDGAIYVWPRGTTTGEESMLFSSTVGNLIGAPTPRDKGEVEVTALIAPSMRPGRAFRVSSEQVSGDYVAKTVVFHGDTHGQDWYVTVTGAPL